jgi:hypothetical protein
MGNFEICSHLVAEVQANRCWREKEESIKPRWLKKKKGWRTGPTLSQQVEREIPGS